MVAAVGTVEEVMGMARDLVPKRHHSTAQGTPSELATP